MEPIKNRYDFVLLFDVKNGNPNGDPDAGNLPRIDPETGLGLVTDVCLKRKVRNYVAAVAGDRPGHAIYVVERGILNQQHALAYEAVGIKPIHKKLPKEEAKARAITKWMCETFYDIRTFGAVMSNEVNAGQVRGPVQMTFAESIEPITPLEVSITRVAVTKEGEDKEREMGRKHIVPYGLYRVHGFISGRLANDPNKGTGFSESDLKLFWEALLNMFDLDRSATKGEMTTRKLIVFKHESDLGNAPASKLLSRVRVRRVDSSLGPARSFADYEVEIDTSELPSRVSIIDMT